MIQTLLVFYPVLVLLVAVIGAALGLLVLWR